MKTTGMFIAVFLLAGTTVFAQVPRTISYQGSLANADGSAVEDDTITMTFGLYDTSAGGTPLWTESQQVAVQGGSFSVQLGGVSPLDLSFDRQYWLGVTIGTDAEGVPRIPLSASPYSMKALSVADGSITSSSIGGGQVVKKLNGLTDSVTIRGGDNVTVAVDDSTIVIDTSGSGGDVQAGDGLAAETAGGVTTISVATGDGILVVEGALGIDTGFTDDRYVNEGQNGAVTADMIEDGAVTGRTISPGSVTGDHIADGTVGRADIAPGSVDASRLNASGAGAGTVLSYTGQQMAWITPQAAAGGDITGVAAGAGLNGGGDSGEVSLGVGQGEGIVVSDDTVALDTGFVDGRITARVDSRLDETLDARIDTSVEGRFVEQGAPASVETGMLQDGSVTAGKLDAAGAADGAVLAFSGNGLVWTTMDGAGDVTGIVAGPGLSGGGDSGEVTLSVQAGEGMTMVEDILGLDFSFLDGRYIASGAQGAVTGDMIAGGAVTGAHIADGALSGSKLSAGSVTSAELAAGAVGAVQLETGSVTSAALAPGSVTPDKIHPSGAVSGQVLLFNGSSIGWHYPPQSGDITGVSAGSGLTGGGTSGNVTIGLDMGTLNGQFINNGETNSINSPMIIDGSIQNTDIANGTILPEKLGGDGSIGEVLAIGASGPEWTSVAAAGGDTVSAGLGLYKTWDEQGMAKIASGDELPGFGVETLNVGAGAGISVDDDSISVDTSFLDALYIGENEAFSITGGMLDSGVVTPDNISGTGAQFDDIMMYTSDGVLWVPSTDILLNITAGDGMVDNGVGTPVLDIVGGPGISVGADLVSLDFAYLETVYVSQSGTGVVNQTMLQNGAVALDKIDTTGASAGKAIVFDGSSLGWASASGFSIPYADSTASLDTTLWIANGGSGNAIVGTNVGTGDAVVGINNSTGSAIVGLNYGTGDTIVGKNSGTGDVIVGINDGTGKAARFEVTDTASTSSTVDVYNGGGGHGLHTVLDKAASMGNALRAESSASGYTLYGTNTGGGGAAFIENSSAVTPTIIVNNTGTGPVGSFSQNNPASGSNTITTTNTGSGMAVGAVNIGTGMAGHFEINNATNGESAVFGITNGTGPAGRFEATNATATNPAVFATSMGLGPAGHFRITNASSGTAAVHIETNGAGPALKAENTGTGPAAYFDGNVDVNGTVSQTSSVRFKDNITEIDGALAKIALLRGVEFDWKESGEHDIGMIAEEVGEVLPELVNYEADGVNARSMNYANMVAVLVQALKEQQQLIDTQNDRIEALAHRLDALENR